MVEGGAGRRTRDLDSGHVGAGGHEDRVRAGILGRCIDLRDQRAKAILQTSEVSQEATQYVQKTARARQAASEPDGAQAPAAAEAEEGVTAMCGEGFAAQQRRRGLERQEALEYGRRLMKMADDIKFELNKDAVLREGRLIAAR